MDYIKFNNKKKKKRPNTTYFSILFMKCQEKSNLNRENILEVA